MTQGGAGGSNPTWLPNLVGGVSIWKLAIDLNEPKFFDGRLLVPETEGSESLPVNVRWDLTGLLPLRQAQASHPAEVDAAIADFQAALARVAKVFATPASGFDKYKQAFTIPAIDADDGANYFYSATKKKVFVINWGASPRSMRGNAEYVFGYEDWSRVAGDRGGPSSAAAIAAAAAAGGLRPSETMAAAGADEGAKAEEEKKEEKKADQKKPRPWWIWPLFALIAIVLVLLALFLLRACEDPAGGPADGGQDALAEDAAADAAANDDGGDGDGGDDASTSDDGGDDASTSDDGGAPDSGAASGDDGGASDGGGAAGGDDASAGGGDGDGDDGPSGTGGPGGPGGGDGPGSGPVVVQMGGAPGGDGPAAKTGAHRRHYHAKATAWRVSSGNERVTRTEQQGQRFDVWLAPGRTFQGVSIEWRDAAGGWHAH